MPCTWPCAPYNGRRHPVALWGLVGPLLYGDLLRMWRSGLIFCVAHNNWVDFLRCTQQQTTTTSNSCTRARESYRARNCVPKGRVRWAGARRVFHLIMWAWTIHFADTWAGKFVTVVGNVVRVSGISAMVLKASFACPKCGCEQTRQFVDGKFNPPTSCAGANCKARVRSKRGIEPVPNHEASKFRLWSRLNFFLFLRHRRE